MKMVVLLIAMVIDGVIVVRMITSSSRMLLAFCIVLFLLPPYHHQWHWPVVVFRPSFCYFEHPSSWSSYIETILPSIFDQLPSRANSSCRHVVLDQTVFFHCPVNRTIHSCEIAWMIHIICNDFRLCYLVDVSTSMIIYRDDTSLSWKPTRTLPVFLAVDISLTRNLNISLALWLHCLSVAPPTHSEQHSRIKTIFNILSMVTNVPP